MIGLYFFSARTLNDLEVIIKDDLALMSRWETMVRDV